MSVFTIGPLNMNDVRASRAAKAVAGFQRKTGAVDLGALIDLICALMHWTDRSDSDFEDAMRLAREHYAAQTAESPGVSVEFVRTENRAVVPPITLVPDPEPYWKRQMPEFIGLEIQPHMIHRGSSCGDYLEPCGPEEAEVWTVNGCYRSGGREPCEDFATESEARAFLDDLIAAHPHLGPVKT